MWNIPLSIWQAAPKDAAWWMAAMPPSRDIDDYDPLNCIYDDDDSPCPGHEYAVDDTGDLEFCDGSCVTGKENS